MSPAPDPTTAREISGWARTFHLKLRFGLSKLPVCPVRYRLCTPGGADVFYWWTRVMPFMDPVRGAFNFELYGWDVRELRFLVRLLRPGMTFVDIGAHHGLYAILAARAVGATGRVLAFEPSPTVARRLRWHLRLNAARRVELETCALADRASTMTLYVPIGGVDTISSLRPPDLGSGRTRRVEVEVSTLDTITAARRFQAIDLVKLDVEGAELAVLAGATDVLRRHQPMWLFEALDSTAGTFGSSGRALVDRFVALGHRVFEFTPEGWLQPHAPRAVYPLDSNCNLLAVPPAKHPVASALLAPGSPP